MKSVLFVDDEPNVLNGLRRMLRNLHKEWQMDFVGSAVEALQRMEEEPFDVVVSDARMPEMSGTDFLSRVTESWPETVRIILSGESDRDAIVRGLSVAHQFLAKPCDVPTLRAAVIRACCLRDQLSNAALRQIVSLLCSLPSVPAVYQDILRELRSTGTSAEKLGELISRDVAMTTKLLQVVNSSFVGLREQVTTPAQATVFLGTETMKALVLSSGIFAQFRGNRSILDALSRHSINVARHARTIADDELATPHLRDQAFMAGLLHDVGKLVLLESFPEYADVLAETDGDDGALARIEVEVFGVTQAQVGGYLLGLWGLPDPIVEAVAFQHAPGECFHRDFSPLTALHVGHAFEALVSRDHSDTVAVDNHYLAQLGLLERLESWRGACLPDLTELASEGG